jgi:uncharacterized OB-fold protein|tara:strand:- start:110 stop:550 length:441 start_codon:yes stop_codon:yes gene_type:complete
MIENIPLPGTDDIHDKIFWTSALESRLVVQHCSSCEEPRFPPRPMCPKCNSLSSDWRQCSGEGTIYSFVIPRPPLLPAFEKISPYVVALVALKEYPLIRIIGRLKTKDGKDIKSLDETKFNIEDEVEVRFNKLADDVALPYWTLKD